MDINVLRSISMAILVGLSSLTPIAQSQDVKEIDLGKAFELDSKLSTQKVNFGDLLAGQHYAAKVLFKNSTGETLTAI